MSSVLDLIFCSLIVVRIYMFGWLCRASCCSVVSTSMMYHMLSKTRRSSGSLHRVMGEVLVLGLPVVVYKIPYRSFMSNTAGVLEPGESVIGVRPSYYCLSGTTCAPVIAQYITTSLLLLSTW